MCLDHFMPRSYQAVFICITTPCTFETIIHWLALLLLTMLVVVASYLLIATWRYLHAINTLLWEYICPQFLVWFDVGQGDDARDHKREIMWHSAWAWIRVSAKNHTKPWRLHVFFRRSTSCSIPIIRRHCSQNEKKNGWADFTCKMQHLRTSWNCLSQRGNSAAPVATNVLRKLTLRNLSNEPWLQCCKEVAAR